MNKNIKILVCCHKKDIMATQEPYLPIQVGKAVSSINLGIQGDNTGDNISNKNANYAELTAMYWAWKNMKNVDYIGLCHYRRYFDMWNCAGLFQSSSIHPVSDFDRYNYSISPKIIKALECGKIIVAKKQTYRVSNFHEYSEWHISDDIRKVRRIIESSCEEKYLCAFDKIMYKSNKQSPFNMFIMSWSQYDTYCTWLFSILEKMERETDLSHYTGYQNRVFAYLAERLLNVYLLANSLKTRELPILYFDNNWKGMSFFKNIITLFRSNIGFFFVKQI